MSLDCQHPQALDYLGNRPVKGQAYLDLAAEDLARWRAERGLPPEDEIEWVSHFDPAKRKIIYAPGSMEYQAEQDAKRARGEPAQG